MSLDLKFFLNADNLKPGHKIQMKRYIQKNVCKKEETGKVEISVCLATHNGEKYIAEQLESILRQLGTKTPSKPKPPGVQAFPEDRLAIFSCTQPDQKMGQ